MFFCFIFAEYAPSTDSCRREQTGGLVRFFQSRVICGLGFTCRVPSFDRRSIAPRSRSRPPCPCPFMICWCVRCDATPLSLGSCHLPLHLGGRQTAKTAGPDERPEHGGRTSLHFSSNSFFLLHSSQDLAIPCLGIKCKSAKRQRDPSGPRIGMRSDIISTSSRDGMGWDFCGSGRIVKLPPLFRWLLGIGQWRREGTRHGGRWPGLLPWRPARWQTTTTHHTTTREGALFPLFQRHCRSPIPRSPFPVPRDHPDFMSRLSTPTLVGKAALLSCWS